MCANHISSKNIGFKNITLTSMILLASCTYSNNDADIKPTNTVATDKFEWLNQCKSWDDWDKAAPPYRIYADTYYVGTCGISAILIKGDEGHILIDSGTETGANIVIDNIRTLGIIPTDIKIILHSHEHFDHVGGFSILKNITNANIIASEKAAQVLRSGKSSNDDPQDGLHGPTIPVIVHSTIKNGETVTLGNIELTPIETPGHTPGALSWQWEDCTKKSCLSIVYADSLSPISSDTYKFNEHKDYIENYRKGLDRLSNLKCDILITPHPSSNQMVNRMKSIDGLKDSGACVKYASSINERLSKRLEEELENNHSQHEQDRDDHGAL